MTPPPDPRPTGCLVVLVTTAAAINLVLMGFMLFATVVAPSGLGRTPWLPTAMGGFFVLGALGPGLMLMTRLRRNATVMSGLYAWLVVALLAFLVVGPYAAVGM